MSMKNIHQYQDSMVNSIVGPGTLFRGTVETDGLVRIDGDFIGSIYSTGRILVASTGRAKCTIHADNVVIGGVVNGDIFARERVVVFSSGIVIGNIHAPAISVAEDVILHGHCVITGLDTILPEPNQKSARKSIAAAVYSLDFENLTERDKGQNSFDKSLGTANSV